MLVLWAVIFVGYLCAAYMGPFPYWKSYFFLWRVLHANKDRALSCRGRLRLATFLIRIALVSPLYNVLWLVDEIIYPSYRKCSFASPVFIVGPPRSGTTFLHRTLVGDSANFRGVRHLEWRFPFIFLQKIFRSTGLDTLLSRVPYWPSTEVGQVARKMHAHTLGDYEEDGIFFEERFLYHYFLFRRFPYPDLLDFLNDFADIAGPVRDRMLSVHEKVIRKICYLAGGGGQRVVLKENESMQLLSAFAKRYPDSRFILLTRPSVDFVRSYMALSRVSTQCKTGTDPMAIRNWYSQNLSKRIVECKLQIDFFKNDLPIERQVRLSHDVLFQQLVPTFLHIYRSLCVPMSKDNLRRLSDISEEQKVRQRGYKLETYDIFGFETFDQFAEEIVVDHKLEMKKHEESIAASEI